MSSTDSILFESYKTKQLYKSIASNCTEHFNEIIDANEASEALDGAILTSKDFKTSIVNLKLILSSKGILRYREQYKQYKYRNKNELKSITVKKATYDKIKMLAKDFEGIDDLLFEYALDSRYYISDIEIKDLPTALTQDQQLSLLLHDASHDTGKIIKQAIDSAFKEGFYAGQSIKKCRSKTSLDKAFLEALSQRKNKLK